MTIRLVPVLVLVCMTSGIAQAVEPYQPVGHGFPVESREQPDAVNSAPVAIKREAASRLRIGTWNMEWLSGTIADATLRERCLSNRAEHLATKECDKPTRDQSDYDAMKTYFEALGADLMALEEARNEAAIRKVVGAEYNVVMTRQDSEQNLGFAYRKSKLKLESFEEVGRLITSPGLRAGADAIFVTVHGTRFRALALHLKSGCFDPVDALDDPRRDKNGKQPCLALRPQLPVLESWIDARAGEALPFLLLGDFNRRLVREEDVAKAGYVQGSNLRLWPEIDDGNPAGLDLRILNREIKPVACGGQPFGDFIDHIVADARAAAGFLAGSAHHQPYPDGVADRHFLSDHCALTVDMNF